MPTDGSISARLAKGLRGSASRRRHARSLTGVLDLGKAPDADRVGIACNEPLDQIHRMPLVIGGFLAIVAAIAVGNLNRSGDDN
jgi:hypothetical protein